MVLPLKGGKPCFGPSFADPEESFSINLEENVSAGAKLSTGTQGSDEDHEDGLYEIFSSEKEDGKEIIRKPEFVDKAAKNLDEADHAKKNASDEYTRDSEADAESDYGSISDGSFIEEILASDLSKVVTDSIRKCTKVDEGNDEEECFYLGFINPKCGEHSTSAPSGQNCTCQIIDHCLFHANGISKPISDDANMAQLEDDIINDNSNIQFDNKHDDSNAIVQLGEDNEIDINETPKMVENTHGHGYGVVAASLAPKSNEAKARLGSSLNGPYWTKKKILDLPPNDDNWRMSPSVKTPKKCTMCEDCGGRENSEVEKKKRTVKKLNFTQ